MCSSDLPGWERGARSFERICEGWQQQLQGFLSTLGSDVWIEDKRYSLSLHFLRAAHRAGIAQALTLQCGQLDPQPRVIAGKAVLNLLPPGARDKGGAVDELMKLARASRALYAGDDVTDEQVFLLDREDLFTIHVGVGDDSVARYVIPDHASVLPLLGLLINCLSGSRDRAPNRRISAR